EGSWTAGRAVTYATGAWCGGPWTAGPAAAGTAVHGAAVRAVRSEQSEPAEEVRRPAPDRPPMITRTGEPVDHADRRAADHETGGPVITGSAAASRWSAGPAGRRGRAAPRRAGSAGRCAP